jgi:ribosomal protein L11 methyltransferase
VSVRVPADRAEEARARMLALFPEGFEEAAGRDGVELAAYTDAGGQERLRAAFGEVHVAEVPPGWEDRWREFHRPVRVGPLWVGPPWERPPHDALAVVIDPGRAFGTGAHATTRLCLELLPELPRGSLIDLGCGSGVLAIAAARLGFAPVRALDRDADAIEATRRNAAANGVEVRCEIADALTAPLPAADVIVANLTLPLLVVLAPRLDAGVAVTSGYLAGSRFELPGFRRRERRERDGWAADLFERNE